MGKENVKYKHNLELGKFLKVSFNVIDDPDNVVSWKGVELGKLKQRGINWVLVTKDVELFIDERLAVDLSSMLYYLNADVLHLKPSI